MRRQFLRVYVGIALVLLLAAVLTLLLVEHQMRRLIDTQLEESMEPWVWRIKERLAGDDAHPDARRLEQIVDETPFPVALVPRDSVLLSRAVLAKLAQGRAALVWRDSLRLLYAGLDPRHYLVLGPLRPWPWEPGRGGPPRPGPDWPAFWLARWRQRLRSIGADPAQRARALAEMERQLRTGRRLLPRAQVQLPPEAWATLELGEPYPQRTANGLVVHVLAGPDSVLQLGPVEHAAMPWLAHAGTGDGLPPPRERVQRLSPWRRPLLRDAQVLIGALLGILVLIGAAVYWLLRPFEKRIYALAEVAREFGGGRLDRRASDHGADAIALLARRFNEMADRLAGLIERQRELLRAVSHELRTPMARLFFLVDDAQSATDPAERQELLRRVEGSLQDLNDLVEELLAFVRLEGPQESQERESVDLAAVFADIRTVLNDLRPEIAVRVEAGDVRVWAVPRLLRRAVLNLGTNAVRHARRAIGLTAQHTGERVLVHVDDDGEGVPAEARERVFEPFFRLDASRTGDTGGVGLGLAIVQRIAAVHDGRVCATTSPDGGARFTLDLSAGPAGR